MFANGEVSVFRALFKNAHDNWLEPTMQSVTPEGAAWQPPGRVVPAGALYAHVLFSEDALLAGYVGGRKPLFATEFAGRSGFATPPPLGRWDEWARSVQTDVDAMRHYAQAVYAQTDALLEGLSDADLERTLDLSAAGLGTQSVRGLLTILTTHAAVHTGEISAVKGLQEQKGYPF